MKRITADAKSKLINHSDHHKRQCAWQSNV